jgi:hypothetical protein
MCDSPELNHQVGNGLCLRFGRFTHALTVAKPNYLDKAIPDN